MVMKMIQLQDRKFIIDRDSKLPALRAVKSLLQISSSWHSVDVERFKKSSTLEEALAAWEWKTTVDGGGHIVDMFFSGTESQDEKVLLRTLAPFVRSGSHLHCLVDKQIITWTFENGRCIRGYENI